MSGRCFTVNCTPKPPSWKRVFRTMIPYLLPDDVFFDMGVDSEGGSHKLSPGCLYVYLPHFYISTEVKKVLCPGTGNDSWLVHSKLPFCVYCIIFYTG